MGLRSGQRGALMRTDPRWRRVLVLLASAAATFITARLGFWQLDRAAEKADWQARIEQRGQMSPLGGAELARNAADAPLQFQRLVTLTGRWLPRQTLYLDNRQMNARPGFFVVTPLLLAPGDAVLVQRGWMPRDQADRTRLQPLPSAEGEVTLRGRIVPAPSKLFDFGAAERGAIRQNLDLAEFAKEIGLSLRPLSVQQLDGLGAPPDGLQRQWLVPALEVGKHHGYAFQWFALSALILGLYVWFQLLRPRRTRRH